MAFYFGGLVNISLIATFVQDIGWTTIALSDLLIPSMHVSQLSCRVKACWAMANFCELLLQCKKLEELSKLLPEIGTTLIRALQDHEKVVEF